MATEQIFRVDVINNRTGEERAMYVQADHPETARSLALLDAFRLHGWRSCSASEAGKAVES